MSKYSKELKSQILVEIKEVGSVAAVARKHNINDKTIHNWIRADRNKENIEANRSVRQLEKALAEKEKQILVLKSLLKKTYQVWNNEDELLKNS